MIEDEMSCVKCHQYKYYKLFKKKSNICKDCFNSKRRAEKRLHTANRYSIKIKATPKWLTNSHKVQIKSIYQLANDKQVKDNMKYHVDHVIPLNNKNVCGLHVPWNLQILTAIDNIKKGNNF